MPDISEIDDREGLVEFLQTHTDDEIVALAATVDVEDVLGRVFASMERDFAAGSGPSDAVVVQWNVTTPDGVTHIWQITAERDRCTCVSGAQSKADVTLTTSLARFLRLIGGEVNGLKLLATGRLKLKGDLMLATSIEAWFVR